MPQCPWWGTCFSGKILGKIMFYMSTSLGDPFSTVCKVKRGPSGVGAWRLHWIKVRTMFSLLFTRGSKQKGSINKYETRLIPEPQVKSVQFPSIVKSTTKEGPCPTTSHHAAPHRRYQWLLHPQAKFRSVVGAIFSFSDYKPLCFVSRWNYHAIHEVCSKGLYPINKPVRPRLNRKWRAIQLKMKNSREATVCSTDKTTINKAAPFTQNISQNVGQLLSTPWVLWRSTSKTSIYLRATLVFWVTNTAFVIFNS